MRCLWAAAIAAVITSAIPSLSHAQTFSAATAYASSQNSPYFATKTVGKQYFLEDFEDGGINTPGLSVLETAIALFTPSPTTDSVDIDDYTLNGSGTGGISLAPTSPTGTITFAFSNAALGGFPTKAGFVWTDGAPNNSILVTAWNPQGITVQAQYNGLGDNNGSGGTAEDRFIGIEWPAGIQYLRVQSLTGFLEVDHVQYATPVNSPLFVRDRLNGDASSDLMWLKTSTGQMSIWMMTNLAATPGPASVVAPLTWSAQGCGDLDGDGDADIVWRDSATNLFHVWLMSGATVQTNSQVLNSTAVASNFVVIAVADFDGDRKADILIRNANNGDVIVWKMNGNVRVDGQLIGNTNGSQYLGVGDFNGDGRYDVLWRILSSGAVYGWLMNGFTPIESAAVGGINAISQVWQVGAIGDLNADGRADVVWRNTSTGVVNSWLMNNLYKTAGGLSSPIGLDWSMRAGADITGDGKMDIIWTNAANGKVNAWVMDGITKSYGGTMATITVADWAIVND